MEKVPFCLLSQYTCSFWFGCKYPLSNLTEMIKKIPVSPGSLIILNTVASSEAYHCNLPVSSVMCRFAGVTVFWSIELQSDTM